MQVTRRDETGELVTVRAACARCGEAFSQPWAAVTSCICVSCRRELADRFAAIESGSAQGGELADRAAELLRACFAGELASWQE